MFLCTIRGFTVFSGPLAELGQPWSMFHWGVGAGGGETLQHGHKNNCEKASR